jgi:hypothetical protein
LTGLAAACVAVAFSRSPATSVSNYIQSHPEDVPRWAHLVPYGGGNIPPNIEFMRFADSDVSRPPIPI